MPRHWSQNHCLHFSGSDIQKSLDSMDTRMAHAQFRQFTWLLPSGWQGMIIGTNTKTKPITMGTASVSVCLTSQCVNVNNVAHHRMRMFQRLLIHGTPKTHHIGVNFRRVAAFGVFSSSKLASPIVGLLIIPCKVLCVAECACDAHRFGRIN